MFSKLLISLKVMNFLRTILLFPSQNFNEFETYFSFDGSYTTFICGMCKKDEQKSVFKSLKL